MVTLDNDPNDAALSGGERWQYPRLLALLTALAAGMTLNALVNGGAFSDRIQWQGIDLFDKAAPVEASAGVSGSSGPGVNDVEACGRIEQIVHTACGLRQRDRDAEGLRRCVAYELKYTLWSTYGCR
ncbi:MAG: hypothetical protein RH942_15155 [Kiloniellaceae bacterium]